MYNDFYVVRVVTRNFASDWFQGVRSLFGKRMKGYENATTKATKEIITEIKAKGEIKWHRINIQEVGKDGILINVYGEYK